MGANVYGLDQAAIFGKQLSEFTLPDHTTASIRTLNGKYSVKFQNYSRVVDIENAQSVTFRSAQTVDGFDVVVLNKTEVNCPRKTQLLVMRGKEIRSWDFGNCKAWPEIAIGPQSVSFDVPNGASATRYVLAGGQLSYADVAYRPQILDAVHFNNAVQAAPVVPASMAPSTAAAPAAMPNPLAAVAAPAPAPAIAIAPVSPASAVAASDASAGAAPVKSSQSSSTSSRGGAAMPPAPTTALVFKAKAPLTIYLDK